jgi:hypothetical protein
MNCKEYIVNRWCLLSFSVPAWCPVKICEECGRLFICSDHGALDWNSFCEQCLRRSLEIQTTIEALRRMRYADYLRTRHWQSLRLSKLEQAHRRCELCFSSKALEVHHKTYTNRGNEILSDLIVLCHPCHSKFHNKLPRWVQ